MAETSESGWALVASVGTTEAPLRLAIEEAAAGGAAAALLLYGRGMEQRPTPLQVAASVEAHGQSLGLTTRCVELPEPENLSRTVEAVKQAVGYLASEPARLVFDISGGTKAMSAALAYVALGLTGREVTIRYTGGQKRDEQGRVIGKMETTTTELWRIQYGRVLDDLAKGRFHHAYVAAETLPDTGPAGFLKAATLGLADWDGFRYVAAEERLRASRRNAELLSDDPELAGVAHLVLRLLGPATLIHHTLDLLDDPQKAERVRPERDGQRLRTGLLSIVADALANAQRRLSEGRHTDAVLRAYRAVEVAGQLALLSKGVNPWKVDWSKVDETAKRDFATDAGYQLPEKLALNDGVRLLTILARSPKAVDQNGLQGLQQMRNYSFLEHGYDARVDARKAKEAIETANTLIGQVLQLAGIEEDIDTKIAEVSFVL